MPAFSTRVASQLLVQQRTGDLSRRTHFAQTAHAVGGTHFHTSLIIGLLPLALTGPASPQRRFNVDASAARAGVHV